MPTIAGDAGTFPLHLVPFPGHAIGTGQSAHLPWAQSTPDPITTVVWTSWVELNPQTARDLNVETEDIVVLESAAGQFIRVPVYVNPATPPNVAAVPVGQGHRHYTSYAANRGANVLSILAQAEDEATGALAWAATRVRITKTNERYKLASLEGIVETTFFPHEPVVGVFRPGQTTPENGH
jgi:molybdopterin-containing oxidoreductase family iron-sulfur binding subunit